MNTLEYLGGKPQYKYPAHYNQPNDVPIYFLSHHINWLVKMPELLNKDCVTVEIGALYGGASVFMLDKYCKKNGHHTVIDININDYIKNNLKPYPNHTYLLGESADKIKSIAKESVDLVYIDGNHMSKHVLEDAVNSFYVLKNGGYIVFDDYGWGLNNPSHCQPKTAIDSFLLSYEKYLTVKSVGWQVIVQKKEYVLNNEEKSSNYIG